jgi:hypothetical protein
MMRRVRLILLAIGALGSQRPALAQWQYSLDAGASYLRQAGIPESGALTLGGTVDAATRATYFRSSVLSAGSSGGSGWTGTGQAVALGGIVDPRARLFRWELSGAASAFSQSATRPTTTGELAAGLQTGSPLFGASFGGGGGFSAHARDVTPVRRASATGWWIFAAERFDAAVDFTHTRQQRFLAPSIPATYLDGSASWRHERGGFSFGGTVGYRKVTAGNVARGAWASGEAMLWVAPHSAIVFSGGRTPADIVRGFPVTTYASVALRFASRAHQTVNRRVGTGPRVAVARSEGGTVVLEVRAPDARSVELTGDFTAWMPVPLTRDGAIWRLERPISPGLHRLAIRVDGGAWLAPRNLPPVEDELGGGAAVITIP